METHSHFVRNPETYPAGLWL